MNIKDHNQRNVNDYVRAAVMQNAIIFCALGETPQGQITIYMSKVADAKKTAERLRRIADDMELRAEGGKL